MIKERRLSNDERLYAICTRLNNVDSDMWFDWCKISNVDYVVKIHIEDIVDNYVVTKTLLDFYLINDICFMILQYIAEQLKEY